MKPLIQLKQITLVLFIAFGLSPAVQAVTPAPDGGYPSGNTAEGTNALFSLTSGVWNTALGQQSLYHLTTGTQNTATGYQTLFTNTTGSLSTAYGSQSLYNNTTGSFNTATGFRTLFTNTTGSENTGNGFEALAFNTTGSDNTAVGFKALYNSTSSGGNTAVGSDALFSAVTSPENVAVGFHALTSMSGTNGFSVAVGFQALDSVTTGGQNTAVGDNALANVTTGTLNTALGDVAGFGVDSGSNIITIGAFVSGVSSFFGEINDSCYIDNAFGQPVDPGTGTVLAVDGDGKLGTFLSSERYKKDITPMDQASEALLALRPVTFHYNYDKTNRPQYGLVAEDVAKVNPNLVVRDKKGELVTVRYEQINAMLLNEFLKEHKAFMEERRTVEELKREVAALTAGLQRVSAQLEATKPATQVADSN